MNFDPSIPWSGTVPIKSLVPNPDQPRKWFDEAALDLTAESLASLQVQPVLVIPHTNGDGRVKWMIVDGERRWRALVKLKQTEILVCYRPGITHENLHATSFAANFCRAGHTHAETGAAIDKELRAGRSVRQIAALTGRSDQWVLNEHKLLKLHPELLARMDPPTPKTERLPMKLALLLADLKPFDQLGRYQRIREMPAADAFHKLRMSTGVSHKTRRTPVEDADYLGGKCAMAIKSLDAIATVPLPMLKRLREAGHMEELLSKLDAVAAALDRAGRSLRT